MTPEVTVIIPTHNRSDMLAMTLRTVLWQQDVDLEVIVVDDGSTDDTAQVVSRLGEGGVRLIQDGTRLGVSAARNRGVAEARGEWIAFLDDDDVWAPDKLGRQLHAVRDARRDWVYAGAVKVNRRQEILGGAPPPPPERVLERLPRWNLIPGGCSNVMVAADALSRSGGFDPKLTNLADWDLWIRLGRAGPPACTPEPLVGYRLHAGQSSTDAALVLSEAQLLDRRDGVVVDRGALHHYLAWVCLRAGRRIEALAHFARAVAHRHAGPVRRDLVSIANVRATRWLSQWLPVTTPPGRHEHWSAGADAWLMQLR